jgi:3D (Asp-Asp-Asp) domain-containing protein
MKRLALIVTALLSLSASADAATSKASAKNVEDATLTLRATLYSIPMETDYAGKADGAFLARDSGVLHHAPRAFVRAAAIQGSAKLKDGRLLMTDSVENGEARWKESPHPYAVGAFGCRLLPFRSAAVDKTVIPLGSKLIIPKTRGLKLPDGSVHDGIWYAVDTGGKVKANRIDLFVGEGNDALSTLSERGIGQGGAIGVKLAGQVQGCPTP